MSGSPFPLPQPPPVTADEARNTARLWKGMAGHLATLHDMAGARHAMRERRWWMPCVIALGQATPPPEPGKN